MARRPALDTSGTGCSNAKVRFEVVTRASPAQVGRALTDFSERRLQTLSRTLDPKTYQLRDQGETWSTARESTSYGGGGTGAVRIEPGPDGGSRLLVEWDSTGARPAQRPLLFVLHHGPTGRIISRMWTSALDRFADTDGG